MVNKDTAAALKILYTLAWMFFASYYFSWGANETTVTAPIDESGWVPDGAFASSVSSGAGAGISYRIVEERDED